MIDSTLACGGKSFIKILDNGSKKEIKHLSQLVGKFSDHIFNFYDCYSPLFITHHFTIVMGLQAFFPIFFSSKLLKIGFLIP